MEVGAAIVGLIVAGAQISAALHRFISGYTNAPAAAHSIYQEVNEFRIVLHKLQRIVSSTGLEPLDNAKASLIDTGPISSTLIQCVCTFSELEKELKRMKLDELNLEGKKLGVWYRMKWNFVEQTMSTIISRIQNHKSSLGLLLSILITESIGDVKGLVQDFHAMVAQGVVPLPKKSTNPDSGFRPSISQDKSTESTSDDDAISIRTTTGSLLQRSQSILPSLQSMLFSSRPYRNRSSSESVISVATSKRRGGSWSLDAGDSKYSVFSLPVSISTTSGISLAEAAPISHIHLEIPAQVMHNSSLPTNLYSDPSRLYELLTADEKRIWLAPSPESLEKSLFLKAVDKGLTTIVSLLLLDPSTPKNARTEDGDTALHLAIDNRHVGIVQMLLDNGADVNRIGSGGYTSLHGAVKGGRSLGLIRALLDAAADIEAKTIPENHTPLHLAAIHGSPGVAGLLLEKGANTDAMDKGGCAPLHMAAIYGSLEVAGLLLEKGANIDAKTTKGYTPLHMAAIHGSLEVAGLLLSHGANIAARDVRDYTPLHLAVECDSHEIVSMLLDKGARIDAKAGWNGETPLHLASSRDTVERLIQAGANPNAKNYKGETPLDQAWGHKKMWITALLRKESASDLMEQGRNSLRVM